MQKYILVLFVILSYFNTAKAELKLPAIISSNMVLQRNAEVKLWGWSDQQAVTIKVSWLSEPVKVKVGREGAWQVRLNTTNSKAPQYLHLSDETTAIELTNVLFGEVWLCSGQSNMYRTLSGAWNEPTFYGQETIAAANNPNLRLFNIPRAHSKSPREDLEEFEAWTAANPNSAADFSAVAYFFGSQLQETLDVPVGLIHSSFGGSDVRAWMSGEVIREFEEFDPETVSLKDDWSARLVPTFLFNAMIHPIVRYNISGVIWYQGENNRMEPEKYQELFPAMVEDWRNRWGLGNFPFYYVQIAPFAYDGKADEWKYPDNSAFIREAQQKSLDLIPNSGMAVTLDVGEPHNIHPPKKKQVGDRLFYLALNKTYGFEKVDYSGPVYKLHRVQRDSIIIEFDHAELGLYSPDGLSGFEIAGEDRVFFPAQATILNHRELLVQSDSVPKPVAVRYGWSNYVKGSLFDTHLLPASSFRTDTWNDASRTK